MLVVLRVSRGFSSSENNPCGFKFRDSNHCDFNHCDFNHCDFNHCDFNHCDFNHCDLPLDSFFDRLGRLYRTVGFVRPSRGVSRRQFPVRRGFPHDVGRRPH